MTAPSPTKRPRGRPRAIEPRLSLATAEARLVALARSPQARADTVDAILRVLGHLGKLRRRARRAAVVKTREARGEKRCPSRGGGPPPLKCGLPAGHGGKHSALVETRAPWFGCKTCARTTQCPKHMAVEGDF